MLGSYFLDWLCRVETEGQIGYRYFFERCVVSRVMTPGGFEDEEENREDDTFPLFPGDTQ